MSSIDPISMAQQLATYEVQPFQNRYQTQSDKYQSQISAYGKIESALRAFRTAVEDMNGLNDSVVKNNATFSQEGNLSASVDGNALAGEYQVFVEQVATAHQMSVDLGAGTTSSTPVPATGTMMITMDGKTLNLDLSTVDTDSDGTATVQELVNAINNDENNPGVNATLVRANGETHFMLSGKETGSANAISVSASGTGDATFENAFASASDITTPQDAVIWLGAEGTGLKLTNSSNTFEGVIDGVDLTVTKAQKSGDQPVGMSVGADKEATKEQLNKLVESYNALMSEIDKYTKTGSEDEKRGVLAGDGTLRSLENQISSIFRQNYNSQSLYSVGVSIDRNGKLAIDNEKFEAAQAKDPAALGEMFNGTDQLFDSLEATVKPYLSFSDGVFKSRKDSLQQNISRIDDKLSGLERKYQMSYDRYLAQFTQMNQLMTQMNQTSGLFAI
ncbi:flagellar filament capping protein FliD [Photobacterium galatheae]|uniref:Flagellar hook-associated protein 2 n=1 Tax=Photobacterium galatheae TaxID=1654360 RepID=A0A066RV87_9GAMM|nr:flagellar filament capping protein FliD [Photobacterium galatheae]KDM91607.1 flagellar hook-associated protein [Photobacterium galatheae]MCM0149680.1 flagellar filament capping protein FliD [Photobacterium galatheae]